MTPSWKWPSPLMLVDDIMKDCLQSNTRFFVKTIRRETQPLKLVYPLYSTLHRGLKRRVEERRQLFPYESEGEIMPCYPMAQRGTQGAVYPGI